MIHAIMCCCASMCMSALAAILGFTITQMVLPVVPDSNTTNTLSVTVDYEEFVCPFPDAQMHNSSTGDTSVSSTCVISIAILERF